MSGRAKQSSKATLPLQQPQSWLDTATGLWSNARQLASPHFDARPSDEVSLLVIHNISLPPGAFGGGFIDDLFLGRLDAKAHPYFAGIAHLKVSAHACIFRDGRVTQYVPTTQRAWHAGESLFEGRTRCNDFSIGIELEGADDQPFTDAQYATLTALTKAILKVYLKITPKRIVGHSNIAPGRKTDPGEHFDWLRFRASLVP
ncbi:MAG: 1,6-anhydro-N-acetylmuramyl-L-alanine amidase AmpD [Stagnimonas sp.]|nr:1,6-anhydro-N-acetylmuramyl-L-alanine amidase AmpD [Stagnimonas sp.]